MLKISMSQEAAYMMHNQYHNAVNNSLNADVDTFDSQLGDSLVDKQEEQPNPDEAQIVPQPTRRQSKLKKNKTMKSAKRNSTAGQYKEL